VISVSRFEVPEDQAAAFEAQAHSAFEELSKRPGFLRGRLGRSLDEPGTWALVTEWDSVGSYRRGLSAYDVKLATTPLMALGIPEPSAYEVLASRDEAQVPLPGPSERAR
jgi:heme oxygenase (mycobilin-producing)